MSSTDEGSATALLALYRRYLSVCNDHRFARLTELVAPLVVVNGHEKRVDEYIADLDRVALAFPDFRWELQRAVVEPPWLAVHLRDTGTAAPRGPGTGSSADGAPWETDEFAMYQIRDGRIVEVWAAADNARIPHAPRG
jgi:predicted ester cyclase